ncbi:MAG: hypothetical protein M0P49_03420 [Bacilli bacterium]|nr:hypothetical protein [Bacilli bacterium]
MLYDKFQEYIDLSKKMFEYLNGEINKVNNSIILIVSPLDSDIFAEMKNGITLKLHIYKIISNSPEDITIKNNILFTIIHELFHADQRMYMLEYQNNDKYVDMVEAQVNFMTAIYIINNRVILEELFSFKILIYNLKLFLDKLQKDNGSISYKRITIFDYYYEMFKYLLGSNNQISDLLYYETDIEFHCEDNCSIIKKNNIFNTNIDCFNKIVYDNYVKINRKNHEITVTKPNDVVIIKSHIKDYLKGVIEFL